MKKLLIALFMFGSMFVGIMRAADAAPAAHCFIVSVIVKAKPGSELVLQRLLTKARSIALAAGSGCSLYGIHACTRDNGRFALHEQWDSAASHRTFQARLGAEGLLAQFELAIAERSAVYAEEVLSIADVTPDPF